MRHFLDISQLSEDDVLKLIARANDFKQQSTSLSSVMAMYNDYTVANLFYENSTRTRISFELAAKKLGLSCINFDLERSSVSKGETIEDTFRTLMAMGVDLFVLRHQENGIFNRLSSICDSVHLINAGEGNKAHPSQAMIDMMTILEYKKELSQLKIVVIGDVKHSRVAHSFQQVCALMSVGELVFVAPPKWLPKEMSFGRMTSSLQDGLSNADVVMCLRIQHERLDTGDELDLDTYRRSYALNAATLKLAQKNAIVMHPGPINRGVEIDNEVADGLQSCILQQVKNGVFMRMAIFDRLLSLRS